MKAPSFAYAKPRSLDEAFDLIERPGAKVLAGGQSLIPTLNMRLSAPDLLVDITGIAALKGITLEQGVVRIGAMTTHAELENSSLIDKHVPLLAQAVRHVAHPAIRNRGTLGGSIALADPAAEYPACLVALDAVVFIAGRVGQRQVPAASFFQGLFTTDLKAGELVVAVEINAIGKDDRSVFLELARRHGDYAIVGLAAHNEKLVFLGVGETPVTMPLQKTLEETKQRLARELKPTGDLYNSPMTKRHLASVLVERAWTTLSKPH
jgi:aerobic carbon-monoxide dehydrogenase medium subunit